jgi:hypothetical protein
MQMGVEYCQMQIVYAFFLALIDYHKITPPPHHWDGVFDASTK